MFFFKGEQQGPNKLRRKNTEENQRGRSTTAQFWIGLVGGRRKLNFFFHSTESRIFFFFWDTSGKCGACISYLFPPTLFAQTLSTHLYSHIWTNKMNMGNLLITITLQETGYCLAARKGQEPLPHKPTINLPIAVSFIGRFSHICWRTNTPIAGKHLAHPQQIQHSCTSSRHCRQLVRVVGGKTIIPISISKGNRKDTFSHLPLNTLSVCFTFPQAHFSVIA